MNAIRKLFSNIIFNIRRFRNVLYPPMGIPAAIIREPYDKLSLTSLHYYMSCLRDEMGALLSAYRNSSLPARKRRRIWERMKKCYILRQHLDKAYYEPLYWDWRLERVQFRIQISPEYDKYRALGIIENSPINN